MCSAFCWILVLKIKFYEKQIYVTILFQQLAGIPEKQSISFLGPIIIIPARVSRYKHTKGETGFRGGGNSRRPECNQRAKIWEGDEQSSRPGSPNSFEPRHTESPELFLFLVLGIEPGTS